MKYWFRLRSKYTRAIFLATEAEVKDLVDSRFEFTTADGESTDYALAGDLDIICRADEVPFDFSIGGNPVEEMQEAIEMGRFKWPVS